jgi:hypothetical protein
VSEPINAVDISGYILLGTKRLNIHITLEDLETGDDEYADEYADDETEDEDDAESEDDEVPEDDSDEDEEYDEEDEEPDEEDDEEDDERAASQDDLRHLLRPRRRGRAPEGRPRRAPR